MVSSKILLNLQSRQENYCPLEKPKNKPYGKLLDLGNFSDEILLKISDILPFLLLSKVASTLMFLQRWISRLALWCIMA